MPVTHIMKVVADGRAIHCNTCDMVSWSRADVANGYCGKCHSFAHRVLGRNLTHRCPECTTHYFRADGHICPSPTRTSLLMET